MAGAEPEDDSGLAPESMHARLLKTPVRAVYRRADHLVCIGRGLEREALRAGMPPERVHYIPPGVDLARFRPPEVGERERLRAALGWPLDKAIVLFVGRLSVEKGAMDLLEAWRFADRRDAALVLVGPDMPGHPWDVGAAGRDYVASHDLSGRVLFAGPTTDAAPFYRAADVFVQPSHFEAFGSSAIEAMASGLPVVSSGVGGLADFLVDGENAVLHHVKSPSSLSLALRRMLDDPALRQRLGVRARATAERFELTALLDRFADIVDAAAERR